MLGFVLGIAAVMAADAGKVWTAARLDALAVQTRTSKPKDQFAMLPKQPEVAAAAFDFEVPVLTIDQACFGYPYWDYSSKKLLVNPGGERIVLSTFSADQGAVSKTPQKVAWGEEVSFYASSCKRADLPSYTATNAYGARFSIDPTLQTVTAIADDPGRQGGWPEYLELQASGDEARALVSHLKLRLIGELRDWRSGLAVACGYEHKGPTVDSPYDRNFARCLYNGRINRIEVIDDRSGKILASADRNF